MTLIMSGSSKLSQQKTEVANRSNDLSAIHMTETRMDAYARKQPIFLKETACTQSLVSM